MLEVGGQPILHRALDAFAENGIDEAVIVTGWMRESVEARGSTVVVNDDYENNNILQSLFYAREHMAGGFVFSYSDIVFDPAVVGRLLETPGELVVVADADWRVIYEGRDAHPLSEAELVDLDGEGLVREMGKHLGDEPGRQEFIGMMKVGPEGADVLMRRFDQLEKTASGGENPFPRARSFKQAYITDMMSDLVRHGTPVGVCTIRGGWREIDTEQDLERAMELYRIS